MTKIERSALVRYPAQSMLELVCDIESYPEFLPWCRTSRILSKTEDYVEAELEIVKGVFNKRFSTRNRLTGDGGIKMSLLDGPFSHLEGVWKFLPLREDATKISLILEFEISNKIGALAFGTVFTQICNSMVSAFSRRAKELNHRS